MAARQKKYGCTALFCLFLVKISFCSQSPSDVMIDIKPLDAERFYADTPVSSVMRTMKQLCATMRSIKNFAESDNTCAIARILEIQSLSVCGAFQELDRAVDKGLVIKEDQINMISRLWHFLHEMSKEHQVAAYLRECRGIEHAVKRHR